MELVRIAEPLAAVSTDPCDKAARIFVELM
jgi:hypothetical protein